MRRLYARAAGPPDRRCGLPRGPAQYHSRMETPPAVADRMQALVARIERTFSPESPWVREAFLKVPRHRFIRRRGTAEAGEFIPVDRSHPTTEDLDRIYADEVVMIHHPPSSASQPYVVAKMLDWLEVKPGMKVLEIGTGSGFNAALLAVGTGDPGLVHTLDIQADLVAEAKEHLAEAGYGGVHVRCGDGAYGWPEAAPFDRIIVTAASADLPPAWLSQLAPSGVLVVPFKSPPVGDLQLRLRREGEVHRGGFMSVFYFMSLQGDYRVPAGPPPDWDARRAARHRALAAGTPGVVCPMDWAEWNAFWIFARGGGAAVASLAEGWHQAGRRWVAMMADPLSGLRVVYDDGVLKVYGPAGPAWQIGALVERWKAHGRPGLDRFAVTVEPDPVPGPGEWLDRRPSVALRMVVRDGVSLKQP